MGLETSTTISGLNALWPLGTDPRAEGDNHLRLIKSVVQAVFDDVTAQTLKFKKATTFEAYNGATKRGAWVFGVGADGTFQVAAYTSAGALDAALTVQKTSALYASDATTRRLVLSNLANNWRFTIQHVEGTGFAFVSYDNAGVVQAQLDGRHDGGLAWRGRTLEINAIKANSDAYWYMWVNNVAGAYSGFRFAATPAGIMTLQRMNGAGGVQGNSPLSIMPNDDVNIYGGLLINLADKGVYLSAPGGILNNSLVGTSTDNATLAAGANVEIRTWFGFGVRNSVDATVRWVVDSRSGATAQTGRVNFPTTGAFLEIDGNIKFGGSMISFFGTDLGGALNARAGWNNQTSSNALGFPIGAVIMCFTNGAGLPRNGGVVPCLSSADSIYYRVQGAPSAGSPLQGSWRACGHIDASWVLCQRVG